MRVLIADDEAPARARLRRLLGRETEVEIVAECATGPVASTAIRELDPDVVFLDIDMPGLDGFGVVESLDRGARPHVVFVTAYDDHALRAFEVGAVDYLLKPFTPARFALVLQRARARVASVHAGGAAAPSARPLRRLLVERDGRARFIDVRAIERIDADRNYVELVVGAERFRVRTTMDALGDRLDSAQFVRLNRSTIVRIDVIVEMHDWSHGDYRAVLRDGSTAVFTRRYRAAAAHEFSIG
jgi:two-component system LytT family response regulator